jgi:hypothetical protein
MSKGLRAARWRDSGIVLLFAVAIGWILRDTIRAHVFAGLAREQVVQFMRDGLLEAAPDQVRADVGKYSELKLVEVSSEEWMIRTPGQFGARNWQVWIHFDDDRVTALRVRTADSRDEWPIGAPADRTSTERPLHQE